MIVYLKKKHVNTKRICGAKEKNNGRKVQKFEELRGIEDVRINMFRCFCDCNKEVEEILIEDISRSNLPKVFCKKGVLRNFVKFT